MFAGWRPCHRFLLIHAYRSRRVGDDFVEHTFAGVIRPVIGAGEVRDAIDALIDRAVGQGPNCRTDRRGDYMVAAPDLGVECAFRSNVITDSGGR